MCSIIGSFNLNKFLELVKLNQSRGTFSFSFATLYLDQDRIVNIKLIKEFGEFQEKFIPNDREVSNTRYYIGHVQAPTNGLILDPRRIHPSLLTWQEKQSYLWHNGILKEECVKELQQEHKNLTEWDTKLLHMALVKDPTLSSVLSKIDGSFGGVYICLPENNPCSANMKIFTSDIITLFIDDDLNLSSVEFPNSSRITPGVCYSVEFSRKNIVENFRFSSVSSPYFFRENHDNTRN